MVIPGGVAGVVFWRTHNERTADAARRSARPGWQGSLPSTAPRWPGTRRGLRREEGASVDSCRGEAPDQDASHRPLHELGGDDQLRRPAAADPAEGGRFPPGFE